MIHQIKSLLINHEIIALFLGIPTYYSRLITNLSRKCVHTFSKKINLYN